LVVLVAVAVAVAVLVAVRVRVLLAETVQRHIVLSIATRPTQQRLRFVHD